VYSPPERRYIHLFYEFTRAKHPLPAQLPISDPKIHTANDLLTFCKREPHNHELQEPTRKPSLYRFCKHTNKLFTMTSDNEWKQHIAPDGRVFWHNAITKQSSWNLPQTITIQPRKPITQTKEDIERKTEAWNRRQEQWRTNQPEFKQPPSQSVEASKSQSQPSICKCCKASFASNNQLHKHLQNDCQKHQRKQQKRSKALPPSSSLQAVPQTLPQSPQFERALQQISKAFRPLKTTLQTTSFGWQQSTIASPLLISQNTSYKWKHNTVWTVERFVHQAMREGGFFDKTRTPSEIYQEFLRQYEGEGEGQDTWLEERIAREKEIIATVKSQRYTEQRSLHDSIFQYFKTTTRPSIPSPSRSRGESRREGRKQERRIQRRTFVNFHFTEAYAKWKLGFELGKEVLFHNAQLPGFDFEAWMEEKQRRK
jgi:WW domain-containing protein